MCSVSFAALPGRLFMSRQQLSENGSNTISVFSYSSVSGAARRPPLISGAAR